VVVKPQKFGKTERMSFSRIDEVLEMPNLLDVQKKSYQWFLEEGLKEVLRDVSPITDYSGNLSIEFVDFSLILLPSIPLRSARTATLTTLPP